MIAKVSNSNCCWLLETEISKWKESVKRMSLQALSWLRLVKEPPLSQPILIQLYLHRPKLRLKLKLLLNNKLLEALPPMHLLKLPLLKLMHKLKQKPKLKQRPKPKQRLKLKPKLKLKLLPPQLLQPRLLLLSKSPFQIPQISIKLLPSPLPPLS